MSTPIDNLLEKFSNPVRTSTKEEYTGIGLADVRRIARETKTAERTVEIAALAKGIIPIRYWRNIASLGTDGQARLLSSSVAVVGAGGLGGTVIELLARLGIGHLTVIDGERFTEDNLNRQILCRENDLGLEKAAVAARRIGEINSAVEITPEAVFLTRENAPSLLEGVQLVVDALDRIAIRMILEQAAADLRIPLVHGAIGGFLGQVTTILPGEETLSSIYGPGERMPSRGVESVLGTPTITPAVIASLEAMEVVKLLLKKGDLLDGELLYLELESANFTRIKLSH